MALDLLGALSEPLIQELNLLIGVEGQVEWVERELRLMQSSLEHVEAMEQPGQDVTKWADEAAEIFQEVEDVIDIFLSKTARYRRRGTFKKSVLVFNHLMDRLQLRMKVEKIKLQIRDLSVRRMLQEESGPHASRAPAGPSSSREAPIALDACAAVASIIDKINAMVSQNLLLVIGVIESVEHLRDEFKCLHDILNDFNPAKELDETTRAWMEEIKDASNSTEQIFDSFMNKREQQLRRRRRRRVLFKVPFLALKDLRFCKNIERISYKIQDLCNRKHIDDAEDQSQQQQRESFAYYGIGNDHHHHDHDIISLEEAQRSSYCLSQQIQSIFLRLLSLIDVTEAFARVNQPSDQLQEQLESIRMELKLSLSALLEDVESFEDVKSMEKQNVRLKVSVKEVKEVAFGVDAAIAAFITRTEEERWGAYRRLCAVNEIMDIMQKIRDIFDRRQAYVDELLVLINGKTPDISDGRMAMAYSIELDKISEDGNTVVTDADQTLPLSFLIKPQNIVSFNDELQAVMAQLLADNEQCSVIPIVGMEGIGKTTLAGLIYENSVATRCFPCLAFVSIGSNCNVKAVLKDIEEQVVMSLPEHKKKPMGLGKLNYAEEEPLVMLNDILTVNRYLVVLDDVITTEVWDELMKEFPSTLHGSRIVLTTRDLNVAAHAADSKTVPHKLHLLSDDDSWALFTQTLTVPDGLLELSRKMVMSCGGLPRAIVKLRERFSVVESTSGAWLRLLENLKLDQKPWQKTLNMIKTGGLPLYLNHCLFYLGRFPAEFEIPLRRLIVLWIAEGLVRQRRGDEDPPESVAERYLAELIDRNMVQVTKKKLNGAVKKCRLPYALRQLWSSEAKKVASPKSLTKKGSKLSPSTGKILHLTHHSDRMDISFDYIHGVIKKLSTPLLPGCKHVISFRSFDTREGSQPGEELGEFLNRYISSRYFLSLRVLDLEQVFRPELPKALGELVLLRYLGLRWTYLEFLPSFISKLLNLQTLDVKHTSISTLPTSIWKMEQLRHLYLDESYRCRFVPRPSGYSLTELQTLWSVFIDEDSPVSDGLDSLINLKRLGLASRLMSSQKEAMLLSQLNAVANWVQKLDQLQSLRLKSFDKQGQPWCLPLKSLSGHTNLSSIYFLGRIEEEFLATGLPWALTDLTLSRSRLQEDPMQTLKDLPNLRILRLFSESFIGTRMLCSSGGFPRLGILKLWKLELLEQWKVENGALPNLSDLEIRSCKNLKMLPHELQNPRTLQIFKFSDMPEEWDKYKNVPFSVHNEDNLVSKYDIPEASVILRSQIREKLLKQSIHRSHKIFLWRLAAKELPISSKKCPFCGAEPDSAVHLFFLCKPIKMIWFAKWGVRTDYLTNLSISDWINHILTPSLIFRDSPVNETDFLRFAVILMEKTWLWRNRVVDDHAEVDPDLIYKETCSSFMNMLCISE